MSHPALTRLTVGAAIGALVLGSATLAPATAAKKVKAPSYAAASNGVVGVTETFVVNAPRYAGKTVNLAVGLTGTAGTPLSVALDSAGRGTVNWLPTAAGTWALTGQGAFGPAIGSQFSISAVPTSMSLAVPLQAQPNVATTMSAIVTSASGSLVPQGTVTFSTVYGETLGTANLAPWQGAASIATLNWTPPSPGYFGIVARYNPAAGASGAANTVASSDQGQIFVVPSQPLLTLRMDTTFRIDTPSQITAQLNQVNLNGTIALDYNVNGTTGSITPSTPTVNGGIQTVWVPNFVGNQIVTASFSNSANVTTSTSQNVNVLPARVADPVTAGPSGQGAWPVGAAISLPSRARVAVASSTQSGAPVTLAASGNCVMIGSTLIPVATSGSCELTVTSAGNTDLAPNTATYNFNLTK